MLLNKYGGRTFEDLAQYPIFPYIIQKYFQDKIKLSGEEKKAFRDLKRTTAGINPPKRMEAQEKYGNTSKIVKN
jgi:hypothetical protein